MFSIIVQLSQPSITIFHLVFIGWNNYIMTILSRKHLYIPWFDKIYLQWRTNLRPLYYFEFIVWWVSHLLTWMGQGLWPILQQATRCFGFHFWEFSCLIMPNYIWIVLTCSTLSLKCLTCIFAFSLKKKCTCNFGSLYLVLILIILLWYWKSFPW